MTLHLARGTLKTTRHQAASHGQQRDNMRCHTVTRKQRTRDQPHRSHTWHHPASKAPQRGRHDSTRNQAGNKRTARHGVTPQGVGSESEAEMNHIATTTPHGTTRATVPLRHHAAQCSTTRRSMVADGVRYGKVWGVLGGSGGLEIIWVEGCSYSFPFFLFFILLCLEFDVMLAYPLAVSALS